MTRASAQTGRTSSSAGLDGTLRVWDLSLPGSAAAAVSVIRGHAGPVNSAQFTRDGKEVLSSSEDATARIWEWGGGLVSSVGVPLKADIVPLGPPAFSDDGTRIFRALGDGSVLAWDPRNNATTRVLGPSGPSTRRSVVADGSGAITGTKGTVRLRNVLVGGQPVTETLPAEKAAIYGIGFNETSAILAAGAEDGTVRAWDLGDPGAPRELSGNTTPIYAVAVSPDGTRVASGADDGTVMLWDLADVGSGTVQQRHKGAVYGLAFSPDGRHLAAASADGTVDVTDLTDRSTSTLRGYQRGVGGVAFSPDGSLLATAADDGVRVWDWAERRTVFEVDRPPGELFVAYGPSPDRFATFGFDYKLKSWTCEACGPVDHVLDLAHSRVQRGLTDQERDALNLDRG